MKNIFYKICLFALIGAFIAPVFSQESADSCSVSGKPANLDFTMLDMNGNDVKFSDFKGQVILLDFWATWCAPCRIEIPGFVELFDKYQDQGLQILGVSVDDPVDSLLFYAEEMEMNYPVLVGDGRDDVKDAFGPLYGFPSTFLINRDGNICHQHTGFAPKEKFEEEILQLL